MASRLFLFCILCTIGLLPNFITAVNINSSLGFAREPLSDTVIVLKGKSVVLPCEPKNKEAVEVTWYKDNVPLTLLNPEAHAEGLSGPEVHRTIMNTGDLYIDKIIHRVSNQQGLSKGSILESDQGAYQCSITDGNFTLLSSVINLQVSYIQFLEHPRASKVFIGDAARFTCKVDSIPSATITWEKNHEPLPQDKRREILPSGILLIANVKPEDEGNYRCVAFNKRLNKKKFSNDALLTVMPHNGSFRPPKMLTDDIPIIPIKVLEGTYLNLECAASGYPTPQLVWTYLPPYAEKPETVSSTRPSVNVLVTPDITPRFDGLYNCTAINHESDGSPAFTHQQVYDVSVLVPPYVVKAPASRTLPSAKTIRLDCEVIGVPKPVVTWYKNGQILRINGRFKTKQNSLIISNSDTADTGMYQCHAKNEVGEVWKNAQLLVTILQDAPTPPHTLECTNSTSDSISIAFHDVAKTISNFVAYSYHIMPTDGGVEKHYVYANASGTLTGLIPFTNYTIHVRSYSSSSASQPSEKVVCRTQEGLPIATPEVHLKVIAPTTVMAAWDLISVNLARGFITQHKIQWRLHDQLSSHIEELKGDVLEFPINGLIPGEKYDVRVLSATKKGYPEVPDESMPWYTIKLPERNDTPTAPDVVLKALNSSAIEVSWSIVDEKTSGFKLFYRRQTESLIGPLLFNHDENKHILTGLDAHTQYEVQIQALDPNDEIMGTGVRSIHTLPAKTQGSIIEPPSNLNAEPVSSSEIKLTWKASPSEVSFYTVLYYLVKGINNNSTTPNFAESAKPEIIIGNLIPFSLYEFQVRSHANGSNAGPYSQKVECQTKENVPSAPWGLSVKIINTTTVIADWKEPKEANGLLTHYRVYYSKSQSKPMDTWTHSDTSVSHIIISGLEANTPYGLYVRASTQAGFGKPSITTNILIPTLAIPRITAPNNGSSTLPSSTDTTQDFSEKMWIIVLAVVVFTLTVVCFFAVIYTMRYAKNANSPESSQCLRVRAVHHSNGNGFYRGSPHNQDAERSEEMDFFTPVLFTGSSTNIPPSETSTTHLDTKGGYPNTHLNGTKIPLLGNGKIPNGHIAKSSNTTNSKGELRITENPQFQQLCKTCGSKSSCVCIQGQEPLLSRDETTLSEESQNNNGQTRLSSCA